MPRKCTLCTKIDPVRKSVATVPVASFFQVGAIATHHEALEFIWAICNLIVQQFNTPFIRAAGAVYSPSQHIQQAVNRPLQEIRVWQERLRPRFTHWERNINTAEKLRSSFLSVSLLLHPSTEKQSTRIEAFTRKSRTNPARSLFSTAFNQLPEECQSTVACSQHLSFLTATENSGTFPIPRTRWQIACNERVCAHGARHHNWPLFVIAAILLSDVARRQLRYRYKAGNESYPTPKTACACDVRLLNYAWNNADWLTGNLWSWLSANHQRLRCNGPNGHSDVA